MIITIDLEIEERNEWVIKALNNPTDKFQLYSALTSVAGQLYHSNECTNITVKEK